MAGQSTSTLVAPVWALPVSRERSLAPIAQLHGTGLPFAGYAAGMTAAPQHSTTLGNVAARKDDVRVPLPRGRKR